MTKLRQALRAKYKTPEDAIAALGLDAALLTEDAPAGRTKENHQMSKPTRLAAHALMLTATALTPVLAKDAKVDLMPIFKDVTSKSFDPKKIGMALDEACKGKLAKDADLNDVAVIMHELAELEPGKGADESVSEEQHKAMEAAAHGESKLGIPKNVGEEFSKADKGKTFDAEPMRNFLKEKGLGEDDIETLMGMLPKPGAGANDEDKDDEEKKEMKEKLQAQDAAIKGMVSKPDMEKAIQSAVATEQKRQKDLRLALDEVRPFVGDIAADSAEEVYRSAAKVLQIDGADTIHVSALPTLIKMKPKAGASLDRQPRIAMDEAASKSFNERFPDASRIGRA